MSLLVTHASPTSESGASYVCSVTGFELQPFPRLGTWRVFDNAFAALSSKPHASAEPETWSRFDIVDESTIYTSTNAQGAFAEILAPLRPGVDRLERLAADELEPEVGFKGVKAELADRGMAPGYISAGWRVQHSLAQIGAAQIRWFVDVDSMHTLEALRRRKADLLERLGCRDLDVSVMRSGDRTLTCEMADHISLSVLDDGSVPAGIRFVSRRGSDFECWAIWERARPVVLHETAEIPKEHSDYRAVLTAFGLDTR